MKDDEGKSLLKSLIRVDFVDAQRNMHDEESHRSNRLSVAFSNFYKELLTQPEIAADARKVIDQNNQSLTEHYKLQFTGLLASISGVGTPSVYDRGLKLVSSIEPENALRGSTELYYVDTARNHELPELYNGLGFKNLIYMIIQTRLVHDQWARTEISRPLCHIIFIEEPEVHLHPQVQQTFILNIWNVLNSASGGETALSPQLVITTHSSHILDATEFGSIRHFRRCQANNEDINEAKILNASSIVSLRDFKAYEGEIKGKSFSKNDTLAFLKKYLRLTHCDLFFADAAIIVEGAVEKLLMPTMIDISDQRLKASYLTVLELGGSYAHIFEGLFEFLCIPYLIITDIDSGVSGGRHEACRADTSGAVTTNATLKKRLSVTLISDLQKLEENRKIGHNGNSYITYQLSIPVVEKDTSYSMLPRTFEEAFAYHNLEFLQSENLLSTVKRSESLERIYDNVYKAIRSSDFKKTDFAMSILASSKEWKVPDYIVTGLKWLADRLHGDVTKGGK